MHEISEPGSISARTWRVFPDDEVTYTNAVPKRTMAPVVELVECTVTLLDDWPFVSLEAGGTTGVGCELIVDT